MVCLAWTCMRPPVIPSVATDDTDGCPTSSRQLEVLAAAHQRLDALAELLDADHEVVEGQHHAGQPFDLRHLVEQARDGRVGADQARAAERHAGAAADAA